MTGYLLLYLIFPFHTVYSFCMPCFNSTIHLFYSTFMMFQCMNPTDKVVIFSISFSLRVEVQCDVRWVSLSSGSSLVCLWLSGSHLLLHHQEALQSTMSPTVRTGAPEQEAFACSLAEVICMSTWSRRQALKSSFLKQLLFSRLGNSVRSFAFFCGPGAVRSMRGLFWGKLPPPALYWKRSLRLCLARFKTDMWTGSQWHSLCAHCCPCTHIYPVER